MPKGRGSNARRRTPRQHGHLNDLDRDEARIEAMGHGALKLHILYEASGKVASKRQKKATKLAIQKRLNRQGWVL